jgi:hypothetical protein
MTIISGVSAIRLMATQMYEIKFAQLVAALPIKAPEALAVLFLVRLAMMMKPIKKTASIQTKLSITPVAAFMRYSSDTATFRRRPIDRRVRQTLG